MNEFDIDYYDISASEFNPNKVILHKFGNVGKSLSYEQARILLSAYQAAKLLEKQVEV